MALSSSLAIDRPRGAAGERRRGGLLETFARHVAIEISLEVPRAVQHHPAFRRFFHVEQDRKQVHVGESEIVADEMTSLRDGAVEHGEIWFHLWQRGLDHSAIGAAVRGLREEITHEILAHQQWVDLRVDE